MSPGSLYARQVLYHWATSLAQNSVAHFFNSLKLIFFENFYHFYIYLHVHTLFGPHTPPPRLPGRTHSALLFSNFVGENIRDSKKNKAFLLVLELKTLRCWKQKHKRENLDKAISLDQEGASVCSLLLSNTRAQNGRQWLLLIPLAELYLPLTWDLSRSKVHNLPRLAKRLRGWVRTCSLAGNGIVHNPEKEARTL
jgi:hypothetical protein